MKFYKPFYREALIRASVVGYTDRVLALKHRRNMKSLPNRDIEQKLEDRLSLIGTMDPRFHTSLEMWSDRLTALSLAEQAWRQAGKRHIIIPDEETMDIINSMNVTNISADTIRFPYPAFALELPTTSSMFHPYVLVDTEEFRDQTGLCIARQFSQKMFPDLRHPAVHAGDFEAILKEIKRLTKLGTEKYKDSIRDEHRAKLGPIGGVSDHNVEVGTDIMEELYSTSRFVLRLCIFIQAFPGCLKDGPGIKVEVTPKKGKPSKPKKEPAQKFVLPAGYRKAHRARYCPPHFRELRNPKFRREDANGNLLEVGEPGRTRIVQVKGYISGSASVTHIDKDTPLDKALGN